MGALGHTGDSAPTRLADTGVVGVLYLLAQHSICGSNKLFNAPTHLAETLALGVLDVVGVCKACIAAELFRGRGNTEESAADVITQASSCCLQTAVAAEPWVV